MIKKRPRVKVCGEILINFDFDIHQLNFFSINSKDFFARRRFQRSDFNQQMREYQDFWFQFKNMK